MAKYRKILQGGRYVAVAAYQAGNRWDCPKARAEKKYHTSKAQQLVNDRNSRIKCAALIGANFADSATAFFVTPSFDAAHYPNCQNSSEYWDFCMKEADKYIRRLRRVAQNRGGDIKYLYCPGIGEGGRWHIHMLIDGVTAEDIRDTWGLGGVDYHHLYTDTTWVAARDWYAKANNVNPAAIAKYMMHNASRRKVGKHPWHASRNCSKPTVKTERIPDGESIEPPEGAEILEREKSETLYSSYQFLEYIEPKAAAAPRKRRKRGSSRANVPKAP